MLQLICAVARRVVVECFGSRVDVYRDTEDTENDD